MDRTALVLEPHDDDLVIGVGGTVIQLLDSGWDVGSVQVTDGRYGDHTSDQRLSEEELVERRRIEKEKEAEYLGIDVEYLDVEDGTVQQFLESDEAAETIENLSENIDQSRPDIVFFPRPDEDHPDHRGTYRLARGALDQSGYEPLQMLYEVWQLPFQEKDPGNIETRLAVNVDGVYDRKLTALKIHQSQDYPEESLTSEQLESIPPDQLQQELQDGHGDFSENMDLRDRFYASQIGMIADRYDRGEVLGTPSDYGDVRTVLPDSLEYTRFDQVLHGSGVEDRD